MATDVTFPAATASLWSFRSLCVLLLAPPYLTDLAGLSMEDHEIEKRSAAREDASLSVVEFALVFSTLFIAISASASAFRGFIRASLRIISRVASGVLIRPLKLFPVLGAL